MLSNARPGSTLERRFANLATMRRDALGRRELALAMVWLAIGCGGGSDPGPGDIGVYDLGPDDPRPIDLGPEPYACEEDFVWDHDSDSTTVCIPWSPCPVGTAVLDDGSDVTDRSCATCGVGTFSDSINAAACAPWRTCGPGSFEANVGDVDHDRECGSCASGSFTSTSNAAACAQWTDCVAGEYVAVPGSRSADRVCATCAPGTYTSGPNRAECLDADACPAGTIETEPASAESGPTCVDCQPGQYCAGDHDPAVACGGGDATWDHDMDPATPCVERSDCDPGTSVLDHGNAVTNRTCGECVDGFSVSQNVEQCVPWTPCLVGFVEVTPGTTTSDRVCGHGPEWVYQFGTVRDEIVRALALGSDGSVALAGETTGAFPFQVYTRTFDLFVQKRDPDGSVLWTRQLASFGQDFGYAIDVSSDGRVIVAGYTTVALPGQTAAGGDDAFLMLFDSNGDTSWMRQFGSNGSDQAVGVRFDADGNVIVVGGVSGALSGQTHLGNTDAFVRKYDSTGALLWTRQFGSDGRDIATEVAVSANGGILVTGFVAGALPGQSFAGASDLFLRRYDADGAEAWTRQLGTTGVDNGTGVAVDANDNVIVCAETGGALPGETSLGSRDAALLKYDPDGTLLWNRQFGTSGGETNTSVDVDLQTGRIVVAGNTTGALPGQTPIGSGDAFVSAFDSDGAALWNQQFGTAWNDLPVTRVGTDGRVIVAGGVQLTLPGQQSSGGWDAFVMRLRVP